MSPERAAEIAAKLCAKIATFDRTGAAFDALGRYDIAHGLALLHNVMQRLFVRLKYTEDESVRDLFESRFTQLIESGTLFDIQLLADVQRWKVPRKTFVKDMCRLAVVEQLSPKLCRQCEGRGGWLNRKGLKVTCPQCGGKGDGQYSDRQRAKVLGVHEASWRQSWRERYRAIQAELDKIEGGGLGGLGKRLSR